MTLPSEALAAVPPEIRDKLSEWVELAAREGPGAVAGRLTAHNGRIRADFDRAAAAVERLLRE